MALPASAASWRAVKWLIKKSGEIVPPALFYLMDELDDDAEISDPVWMRVHYRYSRSTPTGTTEDLAGFKLDIVNITSGSIDSSWTAGDFTALEAHLDIFAGKLAFIMSSTHTLKEYRAYSMSFNPDDIGPKHPSGDRPKPFRDSGPPVWVKTKSQVGSLTPAFPYQIAATATFRTGWPKHWGRIYIPGVSDTLTGYGRFSTSLQTTLANAVFDLQDDLAGGGFVLAVPVSSLKSQRFHALLGVDQVVVDDIPDIVRRRRPKQALTRTVGIE